jgi:hypothetical protein
MPIPASEWETSEAISDPRHSIRDRLLAFLASNPDRAYHRRELSDELLGTDWAGFHDLVEDDPSMLTYYEETPDPVFRLHDVVVHDANVELLRVLLDLLVAEGRVEVRDVPLADVDIPGDAGMTDYYRYSGGE